MVDGRTGVSTAGSRHEGLMAGYLNGGRFPGAGELMDMQTTILL